MEARRPAKPIISDPLIIPRVKQVKIQMQKKFFVLPSVFAIVLYDTLNTAQFVEVMQTYTNCIQQTMAQSNMFEYLKSHHM